MEHSQVRCFVAIPLPLSIRLPLSALCQQYFANVKGIRLSSSTNYHITMRFLGSLDMDHIRSLIIGLSDIVQPSFELSFTKIAPFPGHKSPLIAAYIEASDALLTLVEHIEAIVAQFRIDGDIHDFLPHVTLGRARHTLHSEPLTFNQTFQLERWGLYQSVFDKRRVSYHPLANFICL